MELRAAELQALIPLKDELIEWLLGRALPLWDRHGVDRAWGGYYEHLESTPGAGIRGAGAVRRGRVVARQIFTFDVGHRLGWRSPQSDPVAHGCEYLFSRLHQGDGAFHSAVQPETNQPHGPFSLYEHAFYLFALARAHGAASTGFPTEVTAARCLEGLRLRWGKPNGGFDESRPATLPLKANPHMHLLEAALAWIEVATPAERGRWIVLAHELVTLCLERFIADDTGAVREYYDADWRPMRDATGRIVEPGHQFEWAWLLFRWSALPYGTLAQRRAGNSAARRLIDLAERAGVDPVRGVALNELWDDLTVKDAAAKLWPQTERLKAWCKRLEHAENRGEVEWACIQVRKAADGMSRYFLAEPAGLWREVMLPDGRFVAEPCKASSFYHVVSAIEALQHTVRSVGAGQRAKARRETRDDHR